MGAFLLLGAVVTECRIDHKSAHKSAHLWCCVHQHKCQSKIRLVKMTPQKYLLVSKTGGQEENLSGQEQLLNREVITTSHSTVWS